MKLSEADLKTVFQTGETEHVAMFLSPTISSDAIAQTLVAMANCAGGRIVVQSSDNKENGLIPADDMHNKLIDIALSITPRLMMSVPQTISLEDKIYVIAEIPKGLPNVYAYNGHYLKREGKQNTPISPAHLRSLMLQRGDYSYETEFAHNSTLDDIDWTQAETYTQQLTGVSQYSAKEILYQRGCLTKFQDELVPTNAGILLFGKFPQQFIRSSEITAVRFAGDQMGDTFNRQDITGTLPQQIRRTETFLADNLRKSVKLKDTMQREEHYEYPMEAVRELIVNAVAHRDYSIQGDNIRLHMYSQHLEVHSPGSLPGPMTLENLKEERFSRNPIIVQILSDMGFIERLGYGVDRVMELMATTSFHTPKFVNNANGFKVRLSRQSDSDKEPVKTDISKSKVPQPVVHFSGIFNGQEINPRQESALVYLHKAKNSRITNSDLKAMFPDVHPETIRRDLVDLVSKSILQKMGQKRGSYYILVSQDEANDD